MQITRLAALSQPRTCDFRMPDQRTAGAATQGIIRRDERGRANTMAMLPPPPTKPITLPNSVVLAGERKKGIKKRGKEEKKWKSTLRHILEGRG